MMTLEILEFLVGILEFTLGILEFAPSILAALSTMSFGLAKAPLPTSPQARVFSQLSTTTKPRSFSTFSEFCVAGFSSIAVFAAGAISFGALQARMQLSIALSAIPKAILFIVFAVAGAIIIKSHLAYSICAKGLLSPTSTHSPLSASKASGEQNFKVCSLIATRTFAFARLSKLKISKAL